MGHNPHRWIGGGGLRFGWGCCWVGVGLSLVVGARTSLAATALQRVEEAARTARSTVGRHSLASAGRLLHQQTRGAHTHRPQKRSFESSFGCSPRPVHRVRCKLPEATSFRIAVHLRDFTPFEGQLGRLRTAAVRNT